MPVRINNPDDFVYDSVIDGVSGLKLLRVFSMPLKVSTVCTARTVHLLLVIRRSTHCLTYSLSLCLYLYISLSLWLILSLLLSLLLPLFFTGLGLRSCLRCDKFHQQIRERHIHRGRRDDHTDIRKTGTYADCPVRSLTSVMHFTTTSLIISNDVWRTSPQCQWWFCRICGYVTLRASDVRGEEKSLPPPLPSPILISTPFHYSPLPSLSYQYHPI